MEIQSYNAELAIANLMFARIFSNITIQRAQKSKILKNIKVSCVFGQRSRILKNWENSTKRGNMTLPMIVINRTGYTRNTERLNNLHNEVKHEITSQNRKYDLLTPIPIDISYEVSVISKYPSDIDQIASNFLVFFNNDIYVTCEHPKYEGIKLNNQIILDDGVSEEHADELDESTDDFTIATFNFTFKTYLFGGNSKSKLKPATTVSTFTSTYISNIISNGVEVSTELSTEVSTVISNDVVAPDFIPVVNSINFGFYPVPGEVNSNDIPQYINYINARITNPDDLQEVSSSYVDKVVWKIN